jgi:hypothetical protein
MSIEALVAVFNRSEAEGTDRLVLLVMANSANEETGQVWLSTARIAEKARLSKRSVQYALRRLEESGELGARGVHPKHGTNVYVLRCERGADLAPPQEPISEDGGATACTQSQEEPKTAEKPAEAGQESSAVVAVFEHWREVMDKPRAQLTEDRRRKIRARLAEGYDVPRCREAIDGCARSDFHMGRQPGQPTEHNDLTLIMRTGSKLEWFAAMQAPRKIDPFSGREVTQEEDDRWAAAVERKLARDAAPREAARA